MKKLMTLVGISTIALVGFSANVEVDFSRKVRPIRPELHSSGYGALYERRFGNVWDECIKAMNFDSVRTHDLSLINFGARVVDSHFIFPLQHLDATNPSNYYFKATDFLLQLQREIGLKIFYRLGVSIEHTGLRHFNAVIPEDFDKMAESFAATIRHYNYGWADGFKWNIAYWEIWNEPDGHNNMWCFDGKDDKDPENDATRKKLFIEFFVKVLKRLKSEFPELKIGGPALCSMNESYFRPLLQACKDAGLKPDFISWHYYGNNPDFLVGTAEKAKKICADYGMDDIEFIINEWHYIPPKGWVSMKPWETDATAINGIDSACYTLTSLIKLQHSLFAQAYFYGCRHDGNWGYRNYDRTLNKNFYALKAFGSLMKGGYTDICEAKSDDTRVTAMPVMGADGKQALLVVDYLGDRKDIVVSVKGVTNGRKANVNVISDKNNLEPCQARYKDGILTLGKPDAYSVAFLVKFE